MATTKSKVDDMKFGRVNRTMVRMSSAGVKKMPVFVHATMIPRSCEKLWSMIRQATAQEAGSEIIEIEFDTGLDGVEALGRWLYGSTRLVISDNHLDFEGEMNCLIDAHGFARDLDIVPFMDSVIDELMQFCDGTLLPRGHSLYDLENVIGFVLEAFPAGSHGRDLMVLWLAYGDYERSLADVQPSGGVSAVANQLALELGITRGTTREQRDSLAFVTELASALAIARGMTTG